ncbi:PREDICTED: proton-coupled amino acid transporter-like protein CG1139 [Drosophila arizonae]|uniref:Proton-coupled amino acid transporter-like protein CG1139 n=1 Tax=Drosophila arizonae TaxID=7263 RepID=A0ABM1PB68_DROAR|nr:PREDICTED: proton-coupled amino acid transporter-like protein CG1139 [Drosophila arizonae]
MAEKSNEKVFDPYEAREVEKPLSNCDALLSLLKCVVGTGCLALPLAFFYVGYVGGIILTIVVTALLIYGLQLLIRCMVESSRRNMVGYMTFPETMSYAISVGPKCCHWASKCSGHLVNAILIFSHYGVCVVYIVFVSVNVKQVIDHNCKELDVRLYCFIVGMLSLPLFLLRHLKYLVPTNIIANILMYTGFGCIFYYFFTNLPPIKDVELFNYQLPLFFGILLFATSSVGVMLAIESKMAKPRDYLGWFGVLNRGAVFVALTYIIFGFMGYWRYGSIVAASVTLNMPTSEALAQVIKLFIAISVFFTFPLSGYVVVDIVCNQYIAKNHNPKNPHMIEYIFRACFVIVCTANAIAFPNLGPLLALVGAFSISLLNIIFPCWIEICLLYGSSYGPGKWKLVKDIIIIIIGLAILGYGTYSAIMDMIREYGGSNNADAGADNSNKTKGAEDIEDELNAATINDPIIDDITPAQKFYF